MSVDQWILFGAASIGAAAAIIAACFRPPARGDERPKPGHGIRYTTDQRNAAADEVSRERILIRQPLVRPLPRTPFIVYRRLTMESRADLVVPLERATAVEYASWVRALADGTRVQVVSLLARAGDPMSVGQIVAALDVAQSTVSAHLKVLADVGFVLVQGRGTARYYRINDACVACFPTAADVVMGRPAPDPQLAADRTGTSPTGTRESSHGR